MSMTYLAISICVDKEGLSVSLNIYELGHLEFNQIHFYFFFFHLQFQAIKDSCPLLEYHELAHKSSYFNLTVRVQSIFIQNYHVIFDI